MTTHFPIGRCIRTLGAVVLMLPLANEAIAANREHEQLMADIRMLQEQNQQLQVSLNALSEVLKAVVGRIDDQGNTVRKTMADQRLLVETLSGDVRVVREKLDDTNVRISSLSQEFEALRTTMTAPPPAPMMPPADGTLPPPDDTAQGTVPPSQPLITGLSPQRLYDTAFADYSSGQWSLAVQGFETYLKAFPRSEQADNAQFYVGEALFLDNKLDQAVAAYDKVITNYPTGDAASMAYYRRGLALERLNEPDRARESFETVVQKFPDSDASRLAQQRLANQRLAKPGQPRP